MAPRQVVFSVLGDPTNSGCEKNKHTQEPTEKNRTYIRGNSTCQTHGWRNNKGSLALGVLKVLQKDKLELEWNKFKKKRETIIF